MQLSPEGQFISNILGLSLEPNDSVGDVMFYRAIIEWD